MANRCQVFVPLSPCSGQSVPAPSPIQPRLSAASWFRELSWLETKPTHNYCFSAVLIALICLILGGTSAFSGCNGKGERLRLGKGNRTARQSVKRLNLNITLLFISCWHSSIFAQDLRTNVTWNRNCEIPVVKTIFSFGHLCLVWPSPE